MSKPTILLFDVDGTLTVPMQQITQDMLDTLYELRQKRPELHLGIVGGSDFAKQQEKIAPANVLELFDYVFSENGLVAYHKGQLIARQSIASHLGEENLKKLINFILRKLSEIDCPVKRGTFIEYRNGMLNVSPIGRQCSQQERDDFEKFDQIHKIRPALAEAIEKEFAHLNIKVSIGGQISMDLFPQGWDKTYCLRFISDSYGDIHFFGDKTYKGGNDYEIFEHERTIGHSVKSFHDTIRLLRELFL